MRGCKLNKVVAYVFLLAFFFGIGTFLYPQTQVKITVPERDGMQVGKETNVEGTASITGGNYLWVLVHRIEGFEDMWWPQGEGKINPETKKWKAHVVFGGSQDIGYDFGIAAIVVAEKEHLLLKDYMKNAMKTGDWRPIDMPPTVVAPVYRTVNKVSHN